LQLCRNREGNDRYVERGTNTFNEPLVQKIAGTEACKYEVGFYTQPCLPYAAMHFSADGGVVIFGHRSGDMAVHLFNWNAVAEVDDNQSVI